MARRAGLRLVLAVALSAAVACAENFHAYWYGELGRKQVTSMMSMLVSQQASKPKLFLWLDRESGFSTYRKNSALQPLLDFGMVVRPYDRCAGECTHRLFDSLCCVRRLCIFRACCSLRRSSKMAKGTPLQHVEGWGDPTNLPGRADYARALILWHYGGT
jgi:hypothetical protein